MIRIDLPMPEACDVCPLNYDFCWCEGMTKEEWEVHEDAWNDQVCEGERRPEYCQLQEQEAVKPMIAHSSSGVTWWNICGNCKTSINPNDKYCHECGREINWLP